MAIRIRKKKQEIEERRENILNLQSMGYSQYAIVQKLGITRMTMSRDLKAINESTKKGLFGLAKNETLSTYFYNCLQGSTMFKRSVGVFTEMTIMIQRLPNITE